MRFVVLALAMLAACNGKDDTDPPDTVDTDIDIPPTFLGFTEKPSDVERQGEDLRAGLVRIEIEDDGSWTVGDFLAGGKLSGTGNFGIELSDDGPGGNVSDTFGGMTGALFLPVVYDDVNRDEQFVDGSDDLVLGFAGDRWLAWVESGGSETGWRVVDPKSEDFKTYALTEQAVLRLRGLGAFARLSGIYEGEETGIGAVAFDERLVTGGAYSTWTPFSVAVAPDSGQFETTNIDSRPPIDAFQFPEGGLRYVRAVALFFRDVDENGAYSVEEDALLSIGLCYDGKPLHLRYSDTPRTIEVARKLDALGWTSGWRFVTGDFGDETEIGRSELRWVRFGDDCAVSLPD